ncbi:hypothetical protein [[Eubacterium] cellulosolvens]
MEKSYPKAKFSNRLPNGDYLTLSVWPGKKDPDAEVLTVQIRGVREGEWETVGRLAVYRTSDGNYSQLPERPQQVQTETESKSLKSEPSFEDDLLKE